MNEKRNLSSILPTDDIRDKTIEQWNRKLEKDKIRIAKKYSHLFGEIEWNVDFEKLSERQQEILLKGELIRRYDSLTNKDKTIIKNELKMSQFQSKWFKLNYGDKHKLLNYVLNLV